MKLYLVLMVALMSPIVLAENLRLMSFNRVNYYAHKTYVFDLQVNQGCQINQNKPLSSYFVVKQNNGSYSTEALKGNNKTLFTPKVISKNSREVMFSLGIFGHKLFKSTYPKDVRFKAKVFNTSKGCKAEVISFIDGQMIHDNLKKIEAKLVLHSKGFLKGHPKGLTWLRFVEYRKKADCLVGNCQ